MNKTTTTKKLSGSYESFKSHNANAITTNTLNIATNTSGIAINQSAITSGINSVNALTSRVDNNETALAAKQATINKFNCS